MRTWLAAVGAAAVSLFLAATAQAAPIVTQLNVAPDGSVIAGAHELVAMSPDARFLLFDSPAPFVPDDLNGVGDVYVEDRQSGAIERVSVPSTGGQSHGTTFALDISDDGRFVLFGSLGYPFVPGLLGGRHYYVRDRQNETTELVDVTWDGTEASNSVTLIAAMSSDGRYVAFRTRANTILPSANVLLCSTCGYIFVRDRELGTTVAGSTTVGGAPVATQTRFDLSDDGRYLTFTSGSPASASSVPDLLPEDTNGVSDVYRKNLVTGQLQLVSTVPGVGDAAPIGASNGGGASADGTSIGYVRDGAVYVHDMTTGTTTALPSSIGIDDTPTITGDGTAIVFAGASSALPSGAGVYAETIADGSLAPVLSTSDLPASNLVASRDGRFVGLTTSDLSGTGGSNMYLIDRGAPGGSADADGDHVDDVIGTGAGGFRDVIGGQADTVGQVVSVDPGLTLRVSDAADPDGVLVAVGAGAGRVTLAMCGGAFTAHVDAGSTAVLTCGSLTEHVLTGHADIAFGDALVSVPAGGAAKVTDTGGGGYTVQNLGGVPVTVTRHGVASAVPAGQTAAVDTSPPLITPVLAGTLGGGGWYRSNVAVSWSVADGQSVITASNGCSAATVTSDTAGRTFTCTATSGGGTSTRSVTVKRDATPPTATFAAHAAIYTVDQTISFGCTTTDAGSGVATACTGVSAPATAFAPGPVTYTSTATDVAGNTRTISTAFTIRVTGASLCALTTQDVRGSAAYAAATPVQRVAPNLLVAAGCVALNSIGPSTSAARKQALIAGYRATLPPLVQAGWLTAAQAAMLTTLSGSL